MDLGMKKQHLEDYRLTGLAEGAAEETADVIVPDSWPDAERICGCMGNCLIRSKECAPGRISVSGSVKASIMYQAQDGQIKAMSAVLPYTVELSEPSVNEGSMLIAQPRIVSCEGKVVNSRKLQIRATVWVGARVYNKTEHIYCSEVQCQCPLEIRQQELPLLLTKSVKEKSFSVNDELELEDGLPGFGEPLASYVTIQTGDAKLVGTKLVFKGEANIGVLYSDTQGAAQQASFTLPFSQIMDLEDCEEEDVPELTLAMTGLELEVVDDYTEDLRRMTVSMNILAQAAVSGQSLIKPVTDLYSTKYQTQTQQAPLEAASLLERKTISRQLREQMSLETRPKKLLLATVTMPRRETAREGDRVKSRQSLEAALTYMDEEGMVRTEKKKLEATADLELAPTASAQVSCAMAGPISATISGSGAEINCMLDFEFVCTANDSFMILSDAQVLEEEQDKAGQPSAVLVRAQGDLWELAKKYGSRVADIISVNALEGEEADGRMLLIPKA